MTLLYLKLPAVLPYHLNANIPRNALEQTTQAIPLVLGLIILLDSIALQVQINSWTFQVYSLAVPMIVIQHCIAT